MNHMAEVQQEIPIKSKLAHAPSNSLPFKNISKHEINKDKYKITEDSISKATVHQHQQRHYHKKSIYDKLE